MENVTLWPILILAVAISIDGFSVGITYGLRKIKIGFISLLIISGISTLAIYLTICLGAELAEVFSAETAKILGGFFLIGIGIWMVYSSYIEVQGKKIKEEKLIFSLKIDSLGIMINILKQPVTADFDRSGTINYSEAIVLGLALALDALGAGLGTGLSGISNYYLPLIIGITNMILISSGYVIGEKTGDILPDHFEIIPGFIIMSMGLISMI